MTTPNPFSDLDAIRRFLQQDVLPDVAPALAGELRAAIKILGAINAELESLHPRTQSECRELQQLCRELATTLDAPEHAAPLLRKSTGTEPDFESTPDLLRYHAELSTLLGLLIERAGRRRDDTPGTERTLREDLLRRCYATLGRHAARATRWQNVFEPIASGEDERD